MFGEDVLLAIDTTLDQLIENARALQNVHLEELSEDELEAFQKTQQSLIQHLVHLDEHLDEKRKGLSIVRSRSASAEIQKKRKHFEEIHAEYIPQIEKIKRKEPSFLSKRRGKRLLSLAERS